MKNSLIWLAASLGLVISSGCATLEAQTEVDSSFFDRVAVTPPQSDDSYYVSAAAAIDTKIAERGLKPAKNVILFVGDGMGISTITAARIHAGQQKGLDGESYRLTMDTMPWSALSRTYSHDAQIADSAATATAMVSGIKAPARTIGVTQDAVFGQCPTQEGNETKSLFAMAEDAGLATGIVSTARITHATPASTYAQSVSRNWENDTDAQGDCVDIASQLINFDHGDGIELVLGGGRRNFLPAGTIDFEYDDKFGSREDGRNLVEEWVSQAGDKGVFVFDAAGFNEIDFSKDHRILGLFEPSHMQYELDRVDAENEPSIADMTAAAIKRLSQHEDGYVLMIEGGRIDHAHHAGNAVRALQDAIAFDEAIAKAMDMTSPEETLIIVTADHSHTLTISGYSRRGNPILGLASTGVETLKAADGKPYTTLGYANGPGSVCKKGSNDCQRAELSAKAVAEREFLQQSAIPMGSETHAGEDVAIFASGPGAILVSGVMEQNEIFHVMGRSLGLIE